MVKTKKRSKNKKKSVPRVRIQPRPAAKSNEVSLLGKMFRGLGATAGGALGGIVGAPGLGAAAGTSLGAMVSKWLGSGDYAISRNSLVSQVRSSGDIPMMHRVGQTLTIRHKEYLTDVVSSPTVGAFSAQAFPLNPGVQLTFPWLSRIAAAYQEYTIKGMVFHFNSTSGDSVGSTTTSLGTVMMYTDYKAADAPPTSKVELLNEYFACDAKPSVSFCHPIECAPKENPYQVQYVRSFGVPSGEDPKTYDLGTMYIATQGMQAASVNLGELWVTYEIELRKPRSNVVDGLATPMFVSFSNGLSSAGPATIIASPNIVTNTLGVTLSASSASITINIPSGNAGWYAVQAFGNATGVTNFVAPTYVNATQGPSFGTYGNASSVGGSCWYFYYFFVPNNLPASVSINQSAWTGMNGTFEIVVVPVGRM